MDLSAILKEIKEAMRKYPPPYAALGAPYWKLTKDVASCTLNIYEHDGTCNLTEVRLLRSPELYGSATLLGWLYRRDVAKQTEEGGY